MFTNVAGKLCLNKPSHKDNQQEDKYFRWKSNIDFGLKNYEIIRIRNYTSEPKKTLKLVKTSHIEQHRNRKAMHDNMTT